MRHKHKEETHELRGSPKTRENHGTLGQQDSTIDQEYTNRITRPQGRRYGTIIHLSNS